MSKHTPGPWAANKGGRIFAGQIDIGHAFEHELDLSDYCDCHADCTNPPLPRLANARLMAAAPEMKAKLDEMAEFLRIVYACIPEEIAGTCARQITNWEILKAKIEGDEE